jgi:hypothetical protein
LAVPLNSLPDLVGRPRPLISIGDSREFELPFLAAQNGSIAGRSFRLGLFRIDYY